MSVPEFKLPEDLHSKAEPILVLKWAIKELEFAIQLARGARLNAVAERLKEALEIAQETLRKTASH